MLISSDKEYKKLCEMYFNMLKALKSCKEKRHLNCSSQGEGTYVTSSSEDADNLNVISSRNNSRPPKSIDLSLFQGATMPFHWEVLLFGD